MVIVSIFRSVIIWLFISEAPKKLLHKHSLCILTVPAENALVSRTGSGIVRFS